MRFLFRRLFTTTSLLAALLVPVLGAAPSSASAANGHSLATIAFDLNVEQCVLTATSSKDVSNFDFDGVKTELVDGTTVLVFDVIGGDVVTVKSGTAVSSFFVPTDLNCGSVD